MLLFNFTHFIGVGAHIPEAPQEDEDTPYEGEQDSLPLISNIEGYPYDTDGK
jgi:hypothetical protein